MNIVISELYNKKKKNMKGEQFQRIIRILIVNGKPMMIITTVMINNI